MSTWALISLTEVIAAVSRPDVEPDIADTVRRVSETLDAEVAAVISETGVRSALGFGSTENCPVKELLVLAESNSPAGHLSGIGPVHLATAHIEGSGMSLLLARTEERFSPDEVAFVRAVGRVLGLSAKMREALEAERIAVDRERHLAQHDALTGLPNRTTIERTLTTKLHPSRTQTVTALFVDLDNFKLTNDTLGHAFGDEVLMVVGNRLGSVVRRGDTIGRLSGDEFVVICTDIAERAAQNLAARIQEAISQPIRHGHSDHVISASVGIATARPGDSPEQLVSNADLAMYRAKQRGRARIDVFDAALRADLENRVSIGQELRRATRNGEFVAYLQPVVTLPEGEVVSYEALVRWAHPSRGIVSPAEFIPAAEDSGLVISIDRFVIESAIKIQAGFGSPRPVAVNLSARTFADQSLVPWLREKLIEYGVSPSSLAVEVTETALIERVEAAAAQLEAIRELGMKVMIDDFGTGYSSLSHLQVFDVDGVKIDRSFVASVGEDARSSAIVTAVLHMANALDLVVVAEGVESDAQVQTLSELRSNKITVPLLGQGYLFGKPQPAIQILVPRREVAAV
ncbi:MAG: EAL domain-containing protein [Acidimicrobiales bacterium]|nr:EAL domain-containing protein [Acidimicrobiales bacterium]